MPVPRISKEELRRRIEAEEPADRPCILDVRLKYPYEHSTVTLPGARRWAPSGGDAAGLPRDRDIVTYDSDPNELVGSRVAGELMRQGFRAYVLKGGIAEWVGANFPVETKDAPRPAPGAPAKP